MAAKLISISEDLYKDLQKLKVGDESFGSVIHRLMKRQSDQDSFTPAK